MRACGWSSTSGCTCGLRVPATPRSTPGETWTPEVARAFFGRALRAAGGVPGQRDRPLPRLAGPGDQLQARRAGVAGGPGRARAARGAGFDLATWHEAALSLGALGLDDLADELARL